MIVVKNVNRCLLSGQTSIDLNLIKVNVNKIHVKSEWNSAPFSKSATQDKVPERLKPVITKYDEIFHGVVKLTNVQVHLHVNKDIKACRTAHQKNPFCHLRERWKWIKSSATRRHNRAGARTLCMG